MAIFAAAPLDVSIRAFDASYAAIAFSPDGTIQTANQNFLNAVGYRLDEIVGQHHRIFVAAAERDGADYRRFWDALRAGQAQTAEFARLTKTGGVIYIEASCTPILDRSGKVIRVVKLALDVTERAKRAGDLAGQLDAFGRSSALIEFQLDGTVVTANENFLKTLGYRLDEIVGRHHSMFVDPAERGTEAYRAFWADLAAGNFKASEFKRIGKSGEPVWIQASYNPILGVDGRPVKVVKIASDITAQVRDRMRRAEIVEAMVDRINEIAAAATQTAQQSGAASEATASASENVQAVASGAEELASSISEISRQVSEASDISRTAVDRSQAAERVMSELERSAQSIGEVVKLITAIAEQTNLLALNATIEAARAGEAGKGFAVVASEVKALAGQTAKATDEIGSQIAGIQASSSEAAGAITAIRGTIDTLSQINAGISAAIEEQSAVTQDISSNMQTASDGVRTVDRNVTDIAGAARATEAAVRALKEQADRVAA